MEGVPRIPMLGFCIRRSADTPSFKGKLQKFIAVQYGESPDSYSKEIHELESLRAAAIHATPDYSGCATLKKYYCQLHFLKSRFPLNEGSPISINFSWYDVFSDQIHSWSDVDFEVSCILFNIGALHSKVAGADSRTTVDDMKNCVTHYQCAAWAFHHLRSNFAKFFTPDLSSDLLGLMSSICLAQAQECVVEKSLVDNRRSVITAKLLLQIVDYYQLGLKTVDALLKDSSHHSDRMVKALRKWKKMIELKISYYSSLTYLYRGQQAEDQKQFGERVTFYKAAQEKIELALKLSKTFEKSDGVHETLNFVLDVVVGKASAAQKDNEFIYHEKVPEIDAIGETIKGVAIVKPIPLKVDDPSGDIFSRLVPIEAHEASSLYSEEKAKLLRSYAEKIEEKNISLQKFLMAIQLENLQIHDGEHKLPEELIDCCAAMNGKPEAVKTLVELMGTLATMFMDVDEKLEDIKKIFETQSTKEAEDSRVFGKQPPSNVFVELRHEFEKFDKAHTLAKGSNETLREAIELHVKNLRVLMKPLSELAKQIPAPTPIGENEKETVDEMKRLASKVEEMRKQRTSLEKDLRDAVQQDDITQRLVVTPDDDVEALFKQEIAKHNKITQFIDQNLLAQENIMRALTEANARYSGTREATMKVMAERNAFVKGLLTSYEAYDELVGKCSGGVEFYKKLEDGVGKLYGRVRSIAKVEDEEREAKVNAMQTVYPRRVQGPPPPNMQPPIPSAAEPVSGHPKLKDYLANRKNSATAPGAAPVQIPGHTPMPSHAPSAPFQEFPPTNTSFRNQQYNMPNVPFSQHQSTRQSFATQNPTAVPASDFNAAQLPVGYASQAPNTAVGQNYNANAMGYQPYGQPQGGSGSQVPAPLSYGSGTGQVPPQNQTYGSRPATAPPNQNYAKQVDPTTAPQRSYQNPANQNYGATAGSADQSYGVPAGQMQHNYSSQAAAGAQYYGSQTQNYGSQVASAVQNYGPQASSTTTPKYGSYADSSTPTYGSQIQPVSSTPSYGSQVGSSAPSYGGQVSSSTPSYGAQPDSSTPAYGSQRQAASSTPYGMQPASSSTPDYGSQAASSSTPNYGSQAASSTTPNYSSQAASSTTPNYGSQAPSSTTPNYGSQAASSTTPNYGSQAASSMTPNYGPQAPSPIPNYYGSQTPTPHQAAAYQNYSIQNGTKQPSQYSSPSDPSNQQFGSYSSQSPYTPSESNLHAGSGRLQSTSTYSQATGSLFTTPIPQTSSPYDQQQPIQSIQSLFTGTQNIKYPEVISQANYISKDPTFGYLPFTSHFQSYTQPTQESNAYYAYNNIPVETRTSYSQLPEMGGTNVSGTNVSMNSNQQQQNAPGNIPAPQQNAPGNMPVPQQNPPGNIPVPQQNVPGHAQTPHQHAAGNVPPPQQNTPGNIPVPQQNVRGNIPALEQKTAAGPAPSRNMDLLTGIDFSGLPETPVLVPSTYQEKTENQPQHEPFREEEILETEPIFKKEETLSPTIAPKIDSIFLSNLTLEVEKLSQEIELFDQKNISNGFGPSNLDLKWKQVLEIQNTQSAEKTFTIGRNNSTKNRFTDILPFDQDRIIVTTGKEDYINASTLKKLTEAALPLIVTQLPLPETYSNFWHMIFNEGVEIIVSLLADHEQLGHIYYPTVRGQEMTVEPFKIVLETISKGRNHTQRVFSLQRMESQLRKVVIQLQFNDWGPGPLPTSKSSLVHFVLETHSFYDQQRRSHHPVVVHCQGGVGRSGIFAVMSTTVREIQHGHSIMDPVKCAGVASARRRGILIDREYLRWCYNAILHFSKDFLAERGGDSSSVLNGTPKAVTPHPSSAAETGTLSKSKGQGADDPLSSAMLDPLWTLHKFK